MSNYWHGFVTPHRTVQVIINCVLDKEVDVAEFISECEFQCIDLDTNKSYDGLAGTHYVDHKIVAED